jgi:hypothetical protein
LKWIVLTILGLTLASGVFAEPGKREEGEDILQKYLAITEAQKDMLKGFSMEVQIDAKIPKLHKQGKMNALRLISSLGKISYKMLNYWGDDTVKKEVIARYMQAEVQAKADTKSISITPDNYKFKYKGLRQDGARQIYLFDLKPKEKRVGLFKGELWLDSETYLPIRESGVFVKNPSIFLKKGGVRPRLRIKGRRRHSQARGEQGGHADRRHHPDRHRLREHPQGGRRRRLCGRGPHHSVSGLCLPFTADLLPFPKPLLSLCFSYRKLKRVS